MQQFENFGFLVWYLYNQLTKHHRLGYEHTFSVPEFLPSSNMVIMAFRRQIEYKVIFILILHQNTIQGNSGLPSPPPQLMDLIDTLISTTSSHPPGCSLLSPGIFKLDLELEW